MSTKIQGGDSTSKVEVCKLASDSDPSMGPILKQLCQLMSEISDWENEESQKPESQRSKFRLPDLKIPDVRVALPIKVREPTVKWDSKATVNADHEVVDKDGKVLYHSDEPITDGQRFEVYDSDSKETKYYIVRGEGESRKVIRDSKVRPLTLTGRTLTIAAVANTLMDLAEYDIFENPENLIRYAEDVADAVQEYGSDILDAIELGDIDFLSEVVGDSINPVTAVDTVFKRLDDYDVPVLDSVVHPIAEAMEKVDDATKVVTEKVAEPFVDEVTENVEDRGNIGGYIKTITDYANPAHAVDMAAKGVANLAAPAVEVVTEAIGNAANTVAQTVGNAFRGLKFW